MNERVAVPVPFVMRAPCSACGGTTGTVKETGAQDVVRCAQCDRFQYNAPRAETGKPVRSVRSSRDVDISPGLRAEILFERAGGCCEICHNMGAELHVGHLLSVDRGRAQGMSEAALNHPENLAAMCSNCNLGLGNQPVSIRLLMSILMARIERKMKVKK